jgi:hypothetical protein
MRSFILPVVFVATVLMWGCSGGSINDVTTPEDNPRDLSGLEGVWDYTIYSCIVTQFNDGIQIAYDELNYAFTISEDGVYDPYYDAWFEWSYEDDFLLLEHSSNMDVDEFYDYTDIKLNTEVKYYINLNEDKAEMVINGESTSEATFINPDSQLEEVKCTTTYQGTAVRQ